MRDLLESLLEPQVPLFFVVILRVAVGAGFLVQGYDKIQEGYLNVPEEGTSTIPTRLEDKLNTWMKYERPVWEQGVDRRIPMFPWYKTFLEEAVVPNIQVFAILVTIGELAVGGLLVLGFLVRFASIVGIVMVANYLLATWHYGFPEHMFNMLCLLVLLIFAVASAGRCLGIDAYLHDRFPEIPIF
jgi:NADH dehydrogenase